MLEKLLEKKNLSLENDTINVYSRFKWGCISIGR